MYDPISPCTVVIGKFDGVHLGHQLLLNTANIICQKENLKLFAYTFENGNESITDDREKVALLKLYGAEGVFVQPFTDEFKATSPERFVKILKNDFNAKHIVIGFNFRFGKDRLGDAHTMELLCRENGLGLTVCQPVMYGDETISSTRIRTTIKNGDMEDTRNMMGRRFCITSHIIHGKRLGTEMGFPTANMDISEIFLLPKPSVYATVVTMDGVSYSAITNIGSNPTVDSDSNLKAETHIIGFDGDLYGKKITVEFIKKLRDETAFESIEQLKAQLQKDCKNSVKLFKNNC